MRERMHHLEEQLQQLKEESEAEEELRLIVGRLETFAAKVKDGLQHADFETRRDIIRTLVKRVEVDEQHIRIVFRVSPMPFPPSSDDACHHWQHYGGRVHPRRLHGHHLTFAGDKPVAQAVKIGQHRTKRADLFVHPLGTHEH